MEHYSSYNTQGDIRPECLQKANLWKIPTSEEIKIVLAVTGWSGVEFSRRIDTSNQIIRCWLRGDLPIPYAVWCVLCAEANLGQIWK